MIHAILEHIYRLVLFCGALSIIPLTVGVWLHIRSYRRKRWTRTATMAKPAAATGALQSKRGLPLNILMAKLAAFPASERFYGHPRAMNLRETRSKPDF